MGASKCTGGWEGRRLTEARFCFALHIPTNVNPGISVLGSHKIKRELNDLSLQYFTQCLAFNEVSKR